MIACGSDGVISVISNAFPGIFAAMVDSALEGNFNNAKYHNDLLLDVHKWLYIEGNPVGIKAALHILGWCEDLVRLPLWPLSSQNKQHLREAIRHLSPL